MLWMPSMGRKVGIQMDFASPLERDYKLGIQIITCLIQDLSVNLYHVWVKGRGPTSSSHLTPLKRFDL